MAVAKNTGDSGTPNAHTGFGSLQVTLTHTGYTVGTGSNIILIGILTLGNAAATDTTTHAMTWGGEAMTQVGTGVFNGARVCIFYRALTADTGNLNATATWSGGSDAVLGLISFTGAGTPTDAATNTGATDPAGIPAQTSDANGASLAAVAQRGNIVNLNGAPTTPTALYADITNWAGSGCGYVIGGTSNSYEWPVAAIDWASMGIHIPAAGVTPVVPTPGAGVLGMTGRTLGMGFSINMPDVP